METNVMSHVVVDCLLKMAAVSSANLSGGGKLRLRTCLAHALCDPPFLHIVQRACATIDICRTRLAPRGFDTCAVP